MFITHLEIENFRALRSVKVDLHPNVNVFAGVNGAGKSTLISAVHLMFLRYISAMRTGRAIGRGPARNELGKFGDKVHLEIVAEHDGHKFEWSIDREFKGLHSRTTTENLEGLRRFIRLQQTALETPDQANIPLFTTYPVSRAVIDVPLRVRNKEEATQADAFQSTALSTARHFRSFFTWFRDREDYENERRLETRNYRDAQVSAVRTAVERLMPGFRELRVRRRPLRMVVTKNDLELNVDSLSDGEKGLLALAGDLARRLSLTNPALKQPLHGTGLVLIDEIEMHLHPAWQRNTVRGLLDAFPNIQFIFTTHSPQVISELRPEQTFLLNNGEAFSTARSYGMDSTQILRELMGDPGRPMEVVEDIEQLYEQIDAGYFEESEKQLSKLESSVGESDPALTVARSRIRRGKVLRARETHS